MNRPSYIRKTVFRSILCLSLFMTSHLLSITFADEDNDLRFAFSGSFKPEFFYGKNISLLNNCNAWDQILYLRHTLDFKFDAAYGKNKYNTNILFMRLGARNRAVWGNARSIAATTYDEVKIADVVTGGHTHFIPRLFIWLREAWLEMDINEVFNLHTMPRHTFTVGAFSFQLGWGISLGDAYTVAPEPLGFWTEDAVDQYAFGAKLTGEIIENQLKYDIYTAILDNKCSSLRDTAAHILGQEWGYREYPQRGFGKLTYLFAGRLRAWPVNNPGVCSLYFEPYWLFVDQPEQKIEFLGDASAILATLGMSTEFDSKSFGFGFDTSMNFGHQNVKNWDKNSTRFTNFDGINRIANSKVTYNNPQDTTDPLNGKDFPFVAGSTSQTMIEQSTQSETENGKVIGTTTFAGNTVELINKSDRFRRGYENKLKGWMFVTDAGWWNNQHDLQLAVTFGFASGDNNPNFIDKDGDYSGFISFQELYSGRRVRSAYVLGSAKLRRPLSFPLSFPTKGKFASAVGGFTNLIFTGGAIYWHPNSYEGKLKFHPNMIFYWDDLRTRAYDLEAGTESNSFASRFLGTEFSLFVDYYIKPPLRLFFVAGIFVPGAHFTDIQGKPINASQSKIIEELLIRRDREDRTGYSEEIIPNISDDTGYLLNFGVEYKF